MIRRIVAFGVATVVSIMAAGCQGPTATSETQANADDVATVETQEAGALGTAVGTDKHFFVVILPDQDQPERFCAVHPDLRRMKQETLVLSFVNLSGHNNIDIELPQTIVYQGWDVKARLKDDERWTVLLRIPTEPVPDGYVYTVSCLPPEKAGPRVIVP
jgi:hypothetical protein